MDVQAEKKAGQKSTGPTSYSFMSEIAMGAAYADAAGVGGSSDVISGTVATGKASVVEANPMPCEC
jgi:hypothetical protein